MQGKSVSVLLIDAGNTRLKWQWRTVNGVRDTGADDYEQKLEYLPEAQMLDHVMVASVGEHLSLQQQLQQRYGDKLVWLGQPLLEFGDFKHCYAKPERLGVDRWLAMLGARSHFGGPVLVADAGTAFTIDLLNEDGQHQGGFIVPGLTLAQNALFQNTGRVRPFQDERSAGVIAPGQDTLGCVSSGVQRQFLALLQSVMNEYNDHRVFVSGGDGAWLAQQTNTGFYPDLVFDGMEFLCAGYF